MNNPKYESELTENIAPCTSCSDTLTQNDSDNFTVTESSNQDSPILGATSETTKPAKPATALSYIAPIISKIKTTAFEAWQKLPKLSKLSFVAISLLVLLFFIITSILIAIIGILVFNNSHSVSNNDSSYQSHITLPDLDLNLGNLSSASIPFGSDDYTDYNIEYIVAILEQAGFSNINTKALTELEAADLAQKGKLSEITINGNNTFSQGDEFPKNTLIEITYYDAKSVLVPISAKDAETTDTDELVNLFKESGFVNITIQIENDIDPEFSSEILRNEVSINYDALFDSTDVFPIDAKVEIVSHRPMEKYVMKINIDFISNWFFDKYSVDVKLDETELGTLSHGEDGTYEMWLEPGKHSLTFKKYSYKKPEKIVEFKIQGEAEITYQITCHEDSIQADRTEFIDMGAVGEGESMVPKSAKSFKYSNYRDVESELKNAGFTNIKTTILYDIVWGWTSEGEVDNVSINGKTDYSKGDVFKQDAEIVITYHMWESDDPNRPTESESVTEPTPPSTTEKPVVKDPNITIDNNADFAALMRITNQTDAATIQKFVSSHIGHVIEFDGCIAFMAQHGSYKTRFDVCMAGGDFSGRVYGPLFAFEDVSFYDMNVTGSDTVAGGMLFRIAGKITGYSTEGGYIILKPVFLKSR